MGVTEIAGLYKSIREGAGYRAWGMIHSTAEEAEFTIENDPDNCSNPVLRFVSTIRNPQPENTRDYVYFEADGSQRGIAFVWGRDQQKPHTWSGTLKMPQPAKAEQAR